MTRCLVHSLVPLIFAFGSTASYPSIATAQSAPAEVKLSALWVQTPTGVVVQTGAGQMLVIDPRPDGTPYVLDGTRLVIRAAKARLSGAVLVRSWADKVTPPSVPGYSSSATKGPDGSDDGGNGGAGQLGSDGRSGDPGFVSGNVTINLGSISGDGTLYVLANGSMGGKGQAGQEGGKGGRAGRGTDSAGTWPNCDYGGGNAGQPGLGGPGGKGGRGGTGGSGPTLRASQAVLDVSQQVSDGVAPADITAGHIVLDVSGGPGGLPGPGGVGGDGGDGNEGGSGGGACGGGLGSGKLPRTADTKEDLGPGDSGSPGHIQPIAAN